MKNRPLYIGKLLEWKDKDIIKVITGMRRCGKSSILDVFINHLMSNGVNKTQIIKINFEDLDFEDYHDYRLLNEYVNSLIKTDKMYYIFLDEIQLVNMFEKVVNSLYLLKNVDIYLTGSNAYLLSSEIATLLTGRYIEINMYPLSFIEYLDFTSSDKNIEERFLDYITYGSLPYTTELELNKKNIFEYLNGIFSTVVIKDVVTRNKIKDVQTLYSIINFLFDNIGNLTSSNKIANTLTANNKKTNAVTVDSYIKALVDSYIIHKVQRYNIKGKEYLKTQEKYYICDIGLRNAILGLRDIDQGRIIENIVYLELLRRGYNVAIGKLRDETEIDFIASKQDVKYYIQVAYTVFEQKTLDRELKPLRKVKDNYQKVLITMDKSINKDFEGILNINLLDFLIKDTIII